MRKIVFWGEGEDMFTIAILEKGGIIVKRALLGVLVVGTFFLVAACADNSVQQDSVSLSIDADQPSPVRFEGNATPVLLPHTNLYIFLTSSRPLYFRDGNYFQYYRDHWYRSEDLKGPWETVGEEDIPDLLRNLPADYYYNNFPYKVQKSH